MGRNTNLDIYRIAAALMVLAIHVFQTSEKYDFNAGYGGVWMFFILSGYLVGFSLAKGTVKDFYIRRIIRIVPTYYLSLIVIYLIDLVKVLVKGEGVGNLLSSNNPLSARFLLFFSATNMWYPTGNYELWNNRQGIWTISVFVFFYLIAPLLMRLIKNFKQSLVVLTVMIAIRYAFIDVIEALMRKYLTLPESADIRRFCESNPVSQLYCFMLGITLYYAVEESKQAIYMMIIIAIIIVTSFSYYHEELWYTLILAICVVSPALVQMKKAVSIIEFLSKGSFTLYLFHLPFLRIVRSILGRFNIQDGILFIIIMYVSAIIFCYLLYYFVISKIEKGVTK